VILDKPLIRKQYDIKTDKKSVAVFYSPHKYSATNKLVTIPSEFPTDIPRQPLSPDPIMDWHEVSNYGGY